MRTYKASAKRVITMRLLTTKEIEILKYCLPHSSQMWAVKIMGLILDCDFRDAEQLAKIYVKGIESDER